MRKRNNKEKPRDIKSLKIPVPEDLREFLDEKSCILLQCILANYTIQDIAINTGYKRSDIIEKLIDLGKQVCVYQLLGCEIFPENTLSKEYINGWNDCKTKLRSKLNGK